METKKVRLEKGIFHKNNLQVFYGLQVIFMRFSLLLLVTIPVVVDQASCLYNLFFFCRHFSNVKRDFSNWIAVLIFNNVSGNMAHIAIESFADFRNIDKITYLIFR